MNPVIAREHLAEHSHLYYTSRPSRQDRMEYRRDLWTRQRAHDIVLENLRILMDTALSANDFVRVAHFKKWNEETEKSGQAIAIQIEDLESLDGPLTEQEEREFERHYQTL